MSKGSQVQSVLLADDGTFPNNPTLPLLLYASALLPFGTDPASEVKARFGAHGWGGMWRNGVYRYHHYHSEAHEALGVYRGRAKIQFGGPNGRVIRIAHGDIAVLPAGTAHKLIEASPDFSVVGAYPPDQQPDMCYGKAGERPAADQRIAQVPMPDFDPVLGVKGGLTEIW